MSSQQEQYTEALRTSQDAVVQAMESWTRSAQDAFGQVPGAAPAALEPNQVIDQVFDFAERMLEVQREFSKSLAAGAASAAEAARRQTESAVETGRQQAPSATARKSTASGATSRKSTSGATRKRTTSGSGTKSQPKARKK